MKWWGNIISKPRRGVLIPASLIWKIHMKSLPLPWSMSNKSSHDNDFQLSGMPQKAVKQNP